MIQRIGEARPQKLVLLRPVAPVVLSRSPQRSMGPSPRILGNVLS